MGEMERYTQIYKGGMDIYIEGEDERKGNI